MKYFEPYNRHIWIETSEEKPEEKESTVLLPDDYKPVESEFTIVKIKDSSSDCNSKWPRGGNIVVEQRMIREIKIDNKIFHAILENYVLGLVK
tara:strand:- start:773 stop:1051 length:279 start_codon:yes stop_codon:yes gene_type:complete